MSKSKIKIVDDLSLRAEIEQTIEKVSHVQLAQWALSIARHVMPYLEQELLNVEQVEKAFKVNELWQVGQATVHQVRQAGLQIHKVARQCQNEIAKTGARTAGQAVAVGHMKEHAIVASDYAIKVIGLASDNNIKSITEERIWQLEQLQSNGK
ncbi:hypothetical protein QE450_002068 [Paenibacillus sp. SORGH_AS306]|uniref:putative immunity protein n=1 Tax=unclassified Paenibacillus TaxID=185978 RepID=UPI0027856A29|nr:MULTISPECIES: hypothetical protein [unclassified Paenibacillus]MDQ1234570.1 hypothetical protein [Paenibacillus sp. SORGH_AS_0306]MDR6111616.1 hypothetical protein [Paenibacillus sp. SORGH_AS_0338]